MLRRVAVLGGGPGGAFAARLIKLALPASEVTLHESLPSQDTFGFGVGLSISTQQRLRSSDPETFDAISKAAVRGHGFRLHAAAESVHFAGNDQMAVARAALLAILYGQAQRAGVVLEIGGRPNALDLDADLVVAADGAGSVTRSSRAAEFGVNEMFGRQHYIWLGVNKALPDALFAPVRTEHGVFTTHAYPYRADRSTFLVETDKATRRRAGLAGPLAELASGQSDERSRSYLQEAFAPFLDGATLLGNNSRWLTFRTVRCERWYAGNVVLLGDAAHTAHYSIGSGTKLAMEDAIALAASLQVGDGLQQACERYQRARQQSTRRLQGVAARSQLWWEGYADRLDLTPQQLLVSFLTRSGNVSLSEFRVRQAPLADAVLRGYAGASPSGTDDVDAWVIGQPLIRSGTRYASRDAAATGLALARVRSEVIDPLGPEGHDLIAEVTARVRAERADGVELDGGSSRHQVLERLDAAELVRRQTGLLTSVRAPGHYSADLAAGLVSGRVDLVTLQED